MGLRGLGRVGFRIKGIGSGFFLDPDKDMDVGESTGQKSGA